MTNPTKAIQETREFVLRPLHTTLLAIRELLCDTDLTKEQICSLVEFSIRDLEATGVFKDDERLFGLPAGTEIIDTNDDVPTASANEGVE